MIISTEAVSGEYLHVNSCGVQRLDEQDRYTLRASGRMDYHILYIAQGCCYVGPRNRETAAREGSLVLFLPGERQEYAFRASEPSLSCYLHFSGVGCEKLLRQTGLWGSRVTQVGRSHTIEALFEQMKDEYILQKPFCDQLLAAYLFQLFALFGRRLGYLQNQVYQKNRTLIDSVCLHMHETYETSHPLSYYAEYCNLSLSRFSHIFKAGIGQTPVEYLNRIRIQRAKELLLNTSLSIGEVSELAGFSDQNYFGRVFKKMEGQSPRQFARSN